jgi:hypothetical protein
MDFLAGTRFFLIDSHVHFYSSYDTGRFLLSAWENFQRAGGKAGLTNCLGVLLLAEPRGSHWFKDLAERGAFSHRLDAGGISAWEVVSGDEREVLGVRGNNDKKLLLVAGRQLVTAEGLEVLALGTAEEFAEGEPALKTIRKVSEQGGLPLLPWGAGKWFGKRGACVRDIILHGNGVPLFLGDNSGRPAFWPRPSLFRLGEGRGIRILPGSDPLPLRREESRVGTFGFVLERPSSITSFVPGLQQALSDGSTEIRPFGRRVGLLRFVANQLRLRMGSAGDGTARSVSQG